MRWRSASVVVESEPSVVVGTRRPRGSRSCWLTPREDLGAKKRWMMKAFSMVSARASIGDLDLSPPLDRTETPAPRAGHQGLVAQLVPKFLALLELLRPLTRLSGTFASRPLRPKASSASKAASRAPPLEWSQRPAGVGRFLSGACYPHHAGGGADPRGNG